MNQSDGCYAHEEICNDNRRDRGYNEAHAFVTKRKASTT